MLQIQLAFNSINLQLILIITDRTISNFLALSVLEGDSKL